MGDVLTVFTYLLLLAIGLLPVYVAWRRDPTQKIWAWVVYSLLLWPVALFHALFFKPGSQFLAGTKKVQTATRR